MGKSKHVTSRSRGRSNTEENTRQMAENMLKSSKALSQFKKSRTPVDHDWDRLPNLHLAVYLNNLKALNLLIHAGEDVNFRANDGFTPLLLAIRGGHISLVKSLLDAGANPKITDNEGNDALMTAVSKSDAYSFKLLWRHLEKNGGYDANYTNKAGCTILLLAAEKGCEKCFSFIQQRIGNDVSQRTQNGQTALMLAAQSGSLKLIKTIFELDHDVLKEDHAGTTALCFSITSRHQNNFDFFHEKMDQNLMDLYIKRRIELLANPPSSVQDNPSNFYRTILFPVLLYIRNQAREGLDVLLQNEVFHGLSACRKHLQRDEQTLTDLLRLTALLLHSYQTQKQDDETMPVRTQALEQFLDSLGPEMALSVMNEWSEPVHLPLRLTAFLPLQNLIDHQRGRSWLTNKSKELAPHVKSFYRNASCINYCTAGDHQRARTVWKSFLKWYNEMTSTTVGKTEENSASANEEPGCNSVTEKEFLSGSPADQGESKAKTPSRGVPCQTRSGYANALKHNLPTKMSDFSQNSDKIPMASGLALQRTSEVTTDHKKENNDKRTFQGSVKKSFEINPIVSGNPSKSLIELETRRWRDDSSPNPRPCSSDVCLRQSSTKKVDLTIVSSGLNDISRLLDDENRKPIGDSSTLDAPGGYWVARNVDKDRVKEKQQKVKVKGPKHSSAGERFLKIWRTMTLTLDGLEDGDEDSSSGSEDTGSSKKWNSDTKEGKCDSANDECERTRIADCPLDNSSLKKADVDAQSLEKVWLEKSIRYNRYFHHLILQPIKELSRVGNVYFSQMSSSLLESRSSYLGLSVDGKEMFIRHLKISSENMVSIRSMLSNSTTKHGNLLTPKILSDDFDYNGYLLSEVCECNLNEYMKHMQELWYGYNLQAQGFLCQMLSGLQFLHQQSILHGRLKPQNVIIKNNQEVLLSDFGLSKLLPIEHGIMNSEKEFANECGHCWRPRECIGSKSRQLANDVFTEASDVQVAGMLTHFILSGGQHPFGVTVIRCQLNILRGERYSKATSSYGPEAEELIAAMTAYAPKDRPSANAALLYVRKNYNQLRNIHKSFV